MKNGASECLEAVSVRDSESEVELLEESTGSVIDWSIVSIVQLFWTFWCQKWRWNHHWKLSNYFAAATEVSNTHQIVEEKNISL